LHVAPPLIQVVLPVGVSFYTFMAIAYIVDIYRGDFEVASWVEDYDLGTPTPKLPVSPAEADGPRGG